MRIIEVLLPLLATSYGVVAAVANEQPSPKKTYRAKHENMVWKKKPSHLSPCAVKAEEKILWNWNVKKNSICNSIITLDSYTTMTQLHTVVERQLDPVHRRKN